MATKKKSEDLNDDAVLKAKLDREWKAAEAGRKEIDWKWFIYDLWTNGHHYAKWDKNTQQITTTVRDDGRPKVTVNKVRSTLRAVRNYVLRNRPRAEVTPYDMTQEQVDEARKLNLFLDYLHDYLHLRRKLKATVWHALKSSTGWWQVLWDENAADGQGEIAVNVIDPYDLYWDPVARSPEEARYAILAVRRRLDDLKDDPKYKGFTKWDSIKTDSLLAASSLKARLIQYERGSNQTSQKDTLIVREHWCREVENGVSKVYVTTIAGDQIIRPKEETDLTRLPFFRLSCDVEPLAMYSTGWVKDLIPLNKLLNRLESQVAEYNDLMNRGKYVSDKGAGVRIITNENGQIIEKKRGYEVTQQPIAPLANAIFSQIQNVNLYIEDIGGAHDASKGRIPTGAKSGRAIEALQVGDANNMSEIVENAEEFLEEVYEYILSVAAQKYQFARGISPTTTTGERAFISVIGEAAENKPDDATVIPAKAIVDVKITSWLAQTSEARQEAIKSLAEIMLANQTPLDEQTILEAFEIGNVADVVARIRAREEAKREAELQAQVAQNAINAPAQLGAQEAIAAVRSIIQGVPPQEPQAVSPEYIDYIDQFLASPEAAKLPENVRQAIQVYRDHVAHAASQPIPQPTQPTQAGLVS